MLFNSLTFAIFFPVVTVLYFALPHRYRWAMLLAASSVFYMAFIPVYILILFFTIGIDYIAGRLIEGATGAARKRLLWVSLLANALVLCIFKYFNFFNETIGSLVRSLGVPYTVEGLSLILPIGLSFHTFQSVSYVIEVYKKRYPAERHLGIFALYVMFYPQLVAGPIERPQNLLPQFRRKHVFDYQRVTEGLRLMAWGLFLKVVVADNLAPSVDRVFDDVRSFTGAPLVAATVFFAFQIYCDFAGYSLIAIGAARVMGFSLMTNFRQPYLSTSVAEFWRRWHISLSTWFRDYVYVPLGGNRVPASRWAVNILLVFLLSGLWHGASWTYVIWGALHGMYFLVGRWAAPMRDRLLSVAALSRYTGLLTGLRMSATFALVCFAWIFFRAHSLADARYVITNLWPLSGGMSQLEWPVIGLAGIALVMMADLLAEREPVERAVARQPLVRRWAVYYALAASILIWGRFGNRDFIYFQF